MVSGRRKIAAVNMGRTIMAPAYPAAKAATLKKTAVRRRIWVFVSPFRYMDEKNNICDYAKQHAQGKA